MQCDTGCSDCCHVRLSITEVEAAAIRHYVAGWSAAQRRELAPTSSTTDSRPAAVRSTTRPQADRAPASDAGTKRRATRIPDDSRCAALDPAGRCKIYEARPLVCRSHGVPIRLRQSGLPVIQSCHRNFLHTTPDADCVLDQTTLSAVLLAIDQQARADAGHADGAPATTVPQASGPARLRAAGAKARPRAADAKAHPRALATTVPRASDPASPRAAGTPPATGDARTEPGHRVELAGLLAELASI